MITMRKLSKKFISVFSIFFVCYLFLLSVGYALFQETLLVQGTVSTMEYYEGTILPHTPIIVDTANNRYHTESNHKDFVDFDSESWSEDTLTINYDKRLGIVSGSNTNQFHIQIQNPTVLPMTNGQATAEITENGWSFIHSVSATVSKDTILPNETVDITITVTSNMYLPAGSQQVRAAISYTLQNQTKYLYIIINYD